ncbi:hypothetical protein OK016_21270 [Vibrio chagasii]|nr:hypothetical protein [Vibrio chagasii]
MIFQEPMASLNPLHRIGKQSRVETPAIIAVCAPIKRSRPYDRVVI